MNKSEWEKNLCDGCKEHMEPGVDTRVKDGHKMYHWECYWKIIWPQKSRDSRRLKVQS